jgi:hypothetical protein
MGGPWWVLIFFPILTLTTSLKPHKHSPPLQGNIAAPPLEVAAFYYELLGNNESRVVSAASRAQMLHFISLGSESWGNGLQYGLGLMNYSSFGEMFLQIPNATVDMIGHGGADWGSQAMIAGYSPPFNLGICLAMNAAEGMSSKGNNGMAYSNTYCEVYDAIQQTLQVGAPMNCSAKYPPGGGCYCPAGSTYQGNRSLYPIVGSDDDTGGDQFFPPLSCDGLFGLFEKGGANCLQVQRFLGKYPMDAKVITESCCVPAAGELGQCLCKTPQSKVDNLTEYNGGRPWPPDKGAPWNVPSNVTCQDLLAFVAQNSSLKTCSALKLNLDAKKELDVVRGVCCEDPQVDNLDCVCAQDATWRASHTIDPTKGLTCASFVQSFSSTYGIHTCTGVKDLLNFIPADDKNTSKGPLLPLIAQICCAPRDPCLGQAVVIDGGTAAIAQKLDDEGSAQYQTKIAACLPTLNTTHACHVDIVWDAFAEDLGVYTETAITACSCAADMYFWDVQFTLSNLTIGNTTFGASSFSISKLLARMLPAPCMGGGYMTNLTQAFCQGLNSSMGGSADTCTGVWSLGQ